MRTGVVDFTSFEGIRESGFDGFVSVAELRASRLANVPRRQGVYLVLAGDGLILNFLEIGSGGYFKRQDPNVPMSELEANWVFGTVVLYIGKAGGSGSNRTLHKRIGELLKFGEGKPVANGGGRYIWQLRDSDELILCWKITDAEPTDVEKALIAEFRQAYGTRPFANLQD